MPGWHHATSQALESGQLAMAGVALEQHPDRARLFMQWHEMDWPVLWDPFNLLGFLVVPVTYLLDPAGTVLATQPLLDRADDIQGRLADMFSPAGGGHDLAGDDQVPPTDTSSAPAAGEDSSAWSDHSASLATWGGADRIDEAVDAARRALERSDDPVLWFRLGVVLRMRYDSPSRQMGDFTEAVGAWSRALDGDPNQYIWRRRLQQYGPRLAKPYPFYDWVPRARTEIEARGEQPTGLAVEPHGAEFAQPATNMDENGRHETEPDPDARVQTDGQGLVEVEAVLVPPAPQPGEAVRVHLILTPNHALDVHWNNEAGYAELWVSPPHGWQIDRNHQLLPVRPGEVSDENRHLEFEMSVPETGEASGVVTGHLLYYACEGANGVCVYRRQDLRIPISITARHQTQGLAG